MKKPFIDALLAYKGLPYSLVTGDAGCSCVGLLLLALRDIGVLATEFDVNLSGLSVGFARFKFLRKLLEEIAFRVDRAEPGDIFLSRWLDENRRLKSVHHASVLVEDGIQIQCLAHEHGGAGYVQDVQINALDWQRVEEIWRLK